MRFPVVVMIIVTLVLAACAVPSATTATETGTLSPSSLVSLVTYDFSDPTSGWPEGAEEGVKYGYENGNYVIQVDEAPSTGVIWEPSGQILNNFFMQVEATPVDEYVSAYGVISRDRDGHNYYQFLISSSGFYQVWEVQDDEPIEVVPWTESSTINQGGNTNRLGLLAQGDHLTFSVNGESVAEVPDASFSEGAIGLVVNSGDQAGIAVAFDDLSVFVVPGTTEPAPAITEGMPVGAAIAYAYHGLLLDQDLQVLDNVPQDQADTYYIANGWLANVPPTAGTPLSGNTPYMDLCVNNGVPLPPPWGDPGWQKAGDLPADNNFATPIGFPPIAEVWAFSSPLGICYALPRKDAAGVIYALGIICQGQESGKACFWDNIRADGTKIKGADTVGMDPTDMQGGDTLKENCTNCHRGDNAFIIHPDTPLQQTKVDTNTVDTTNPKGRPTFPINPPYMPLGQVTWVNEPSDVSLPQGKDGCGSCHTIPKLTRDYCGLLMRAVLGPPPGGTMPPGGEDVKADVDDLKKRCNDQFKVKWP